MKKIKQQKNQQTTQQHQQDQKELKQQDNQYLQNLSVSVSCASGHQDSIQQSKKGRFYASFTFRFKSDNGLDASSFNSDGEQMRMDQFFDDEIIFQRKVEKRDVVFRPGCLSSKFIKHSSQLIFKFCQDANQASFNELLSQISRLQIPIFQSVKQEQNIYTVNQALEDLFYRKQHTYLIYTFDWVFCHLSFVCCLLIYWIQIQIGPPIQDSQATNKVKQQYILNEKIRLKQNVCYIALYYASERSQQINTDQPVLLILNQFLNYLKRQPCLNIVQISQYQDKMINDIKLFRRIRRKQKEFSSPSNQLILRSQLNKYQHQNKLLTSFQKTYTLLNLICSHNFVSYPILKYYQLDQFKDSRKLYQMKKQYFCLWVLNIVLNQCEKKSIDSLHFSAYYVLMFFAFLKQMEKESNIEGISYLMPILANIKLHMPKVWKHVEQRRPQIQKKLNFYTSKLMKKQYRTQELSQQNAIIWKQTIYQMTQKMSKYLSSFEHVQLEQHKKFYQQFLVHYLHYRRNVQKCYKQQIEKYDREKQIGTSFNMYLLDTFIPRLYEDKNYQYQWKQFQRRAQVVNSKISTSLYKNFIDFCFIGSTFKYQKIQI